MSRDHYISLGNCSMVPSWCRVFSSGTIILNDWYDISTL